MALIPVSYTHLYKGFRIIIPIKEMMINLGRSPSGQDYADLMLRQNKILGNMLGADIDFVFVIDFVIFNCLILSYYTTANILQK